MPSARVTWCAPRHSTGVVIRQPLQAGAVAGVLGAGEVEELRNPGLLLALMSGPAPGYAASICLTRSRDLTVSGAALNKARDPRPAVK